MKKIIIKKDTPCDKAGTVITVQEFRSKYPYTVAGDRTDNRVLELIRSWELYAKSDDRREKRQTDTVLGDWFGIVDTEKQQDKYYNDLISFYGTLRGSSDEIRILINILIEERKREKGYYE